MVLLMCIVGLCFGSFLYAWIFRTKDGKSIVHPGSQCVACKHKLSIQDLIPLVSFFTLRGKCRYCREKISWTSPLVEGLTGVFFAMIFLYHEQQFSLEFVRDLFVIFFLECVFFSDWFYGEISPKWTIVPGLFLFFFSLFFQFHAIFSFVLGIGVGTLFFLFQFFVSRGKWIGLGDVYMGFFMGVILGFPHILFALLGAYVLGALLSIILLAQKKITRKTQIPFGPFLSVATFLAMIMGEGILSFFDFFL